MGNEVGMLDELRGWMRIIFCTSKELQTSVDIDGRTTIEVVVTVLSYEEFGRKRWVRFLRWMLRR